MDNVIQIIYSDGTSEHFEYDVEGRNTKSIDTMGSSVTYTYDEYERLTDLTEGESHITYGYNSYGEFVSKSYENGQKISYDYDSYGRTEEIIVS